ncbi:DNA replication/repair protein RecF [Sphingorhabdus arenilitoris]|uniref:DNA replication and repair protein RecF n=1 Tax=Sphingorhabdus arenilitoris TaxID=1490041 RepID=A0ABV8RDY1_9SPHN
MALTRLSLTDFRNHAQASFRPGRQFTVLHGANGAGKTNILEAVSLLVPGRGLRRAALSDMPRHGGRGGFAIAAEIEDIKLGTGVSLDAPDRRKVRINGAPAAITALSEWLAVIWLTPAMDRLFTDSAGERRRFLDRLVMAVQPSHARYSSQYERAMRQRNKLLSDDRPADPDWLDGLEKAMAENAVQIDASRKRMIDQLGERLAQEPEGPFAIPILSIEGASPTSEAELRAVWQRGRPRDAAAGRTLTGPHRADLLVTHKVKNQPAGLCSTGEQKALLLSVILAHAGLVADIRSEAPVILLDEVAAHLDPARRAALFERLAATGSQLWMTGTEKALFGGLTGDALFIEVDNGQLHL